MGSWMVRGAVLVWAGILLTAVPWTQAANRRVEPQVDPNPAEIQNGADAQNENDPEMLTLDQLVRAQQQFGFDVLNQLAAAQPGSNILLSPLSIAMALHMAQSGAEGSTFEAMSQTFGLSGLTPDSLAAANGELLREIALEDGDPVQLTIANSLWARQGIPLASAFLQRSLDAFDADVNQLDFVAAGAIDQINGWVEQQTQGRIPEIVDEIDPNAILFLINAVYFKGDWSQEFDPSLTESQPFSLSTGSSVPIPLMQQQGSWTYGEVEGSQWVSLPYGESQDLSFVVGLPPEGEDIRDWAQGLGSQSWEMLLGQMGSRPGTVFLPRFELTFETDLVSVLSDLGMEIAFGDQADFRGITAAPTQISEVRHKAVLEVNEEGSEAAAATSVAVVTRSAPVEERPFVMRVDRPFVAAIRDNRTQAILFLALVEDPT